jgi:anti-anti-sigma factor
MEGGGAVGAPAIVTMPAAIDVANVDVIQSQLSAAFLLGAPLVIADLAGTSFCDIAGLRLLLTARQQAAAGGVELRLVLPSGSQMRRLAVLLAADHQLPVYSSVEEATAPSAVPADPPATRRLFALRPKGGPHEPSSMA